MKNKKSALFTISAKIVLTALIFSTMDVSAQKNKNNPFGLVYDNAISKNEKGKISIQPVSYQSENLKISANVYLPADYNENKKYPAIVVAHPNRGVKEQVSGLYAQKLAEKGFITIAFDAAYQGASEGLPRYTDKPSRRIEDIRAAADFISTFKGVDNEHLGVLGICGGGGYTIKAVQSDKRFKAVATVSMFNSGEARRNGFQNPQLSDIQQRLEKASEARKIEATTGKVQYSASFGADMTDEQVAKLPFEMYREGFYYYGRDYKHPNSQTNYTLSSLLDLMSFDANTNVDLITQPLLMIAGEKADSKYMTDAVFKNATNASKKELFVVKNATHIQTYWKDEFVKQISQKLEQFFTENLK